MEENGLKMEEKGSFNTDPEPVEKLNGHFSQSDLYFLDIWRL